MNLSAILILPAVRVRPSLLRTKPVDVIEPNSPIVIVPSTDSVSREPLVAVIAPERVALVAMRLPLSSSSVFAAFQDNVSENLTNDSVNSGSGICSPGFSGSSINGAVPVPT